MPEDEKPIPTVLALLICESVIQDAETQKKTVVGIFDTINASAAPVGLSNVGLYAKLVEGSGEYTFRIRLAGLKGVEEVPPLIDVPFAAKWQVVGRPLELAVNFRGIAFPEFGDYEFQLFADDIYLGRALLQVVTMEMPR